MRIRHKKSFQNLSLIFVFTLFLSGCGVKDFLNTSVGPELDTKTKPTSKSEFFNPGIEVQAAEEKIDRSNPNWMMQYCVSRISEIGVLPSVYERQRGPFISMDPVYLSSRHTRFEEKATCSTDYYIWSVRSESFSSMGIDYGYSLRIWNQYYEALTASTSSNLKDEGWKELLNKDEVGVKPDYSMSYHNSSENLREYLDIFYTNDEEVVYELLIINLN